MSQNYIQKSSGENELFSLDKIEHSLLRAGLDEKKMDTVLNEVRDMVDSLRTTDEVHQHVSKVLQKHTMRCATRYNLKKAIMQLGPAGFPFERFVAALLRAQGYDVAVGQIVQGNCVEHEVDVVARTKDKYVLVECKFHNRPGIKTNVKTALYVKARFDDIRRFEGERNDHKNMLHEVWLVSNTKCTRDAIQYAECAGVHIVDWRYPRGESLSELIDTLGIHPVTALVSLNAQQKAFLIQNNVVLCREVQDNVNVLQSLRLQKKEIQRVLDEANAVCRT